MPIDISLLRPLNEGGNIPLVELWQKSRNLHDGKAAKLCQKSTSSTTHSEGIPSQSTHSSWTPLSADPYGSLGSSSFDSSSLESSTVVSPVKISPKNLTPEIEEDKKEEQSKSSSLALLNYIIDLESKRRATTNELNACRHRLKALQRQRRPSTTPSNPKTKTWNNADQMSLIRHEVQSLKNEIIPENEKKLEQLTKNLENHFLPMVRNQVDDFSYTSSRIPNSDDERVDLSKSFDFSFNSEKSFKQSKRREYEIIDPLYCIGGYEKLCPYEPPPLTEENSVDVSNLSILTGPGSILEQVVFSHAISFINSSKASKIHQTDEQEEKSYNEENHVVFSEESDESHFQLTHLPDSSLLKMNFSMAHSIMGCTNRFDASSDSASEETEDEFPHLVHKQDPKLCHICYREAIHRATKTLHISESPSVPKIPLPTYATFSMFHQSQNYSENTLPLRYVSSTPIAKTSFQLPNNENSTINTKPKIKSFPKFCHSINKLNLFALCASDMLVSRQIQHDFVELILDFYESLICVPKREKKTINPLEQMENISDKIWERCKSVSWRPLLRAYSIFPNSSEDLNLEPNEASRIIIEGYLPSINGYIQLGHVSNFADFVSRWFKTRFGGGNQVKLGSSVLSNQANYSTGKVGVTHCHSNEYVHTVYGSFCQSDDSLRWMLENNMVYAQGKYGPPYQKSLLDDDEDDIKVDGIVLPPKLILPFAHLWGEEYLNHWDLNMKENANGSRDGLPVGFVIPYKRRKFQTKNGKMISRAVENASLSFDHLEYEPREEYGSVATKEKSKQLGNRESGEVITKSIRSNMKKLPRVNLTEKVTKEDIIAESHCNPYSFLRFYE